MRRAVALGCIGVAAVLTAVAIALDPTVIESEPEVRVPRPRRSYVAPAVRTGRWVKGGDA